MSEMLLQQNTILHSELQRLNKYCDELCRELVETLKGEVTNG